MKEKDDTIFFNPANITSIIRIILLPVYLAFVLYGSITMKKIAIIICIIIFLMDYIDGWIAEKCNTKTKIGSHLDVIADRIAEIFFWLAFLSLGLVPLWAPLIVFSRSMITDLIRAQALLKNKGTYDMIQSATGQFIVKSRLMRGLYGGMKMTLFALLTASLTMQADKILSITPALTIIVVILCTLRGIPVISEGIKYLK